jgi:hypothetical protein
MGAGAKVGILGAALAVALALVWFVATDDESSAPEAPTSAAAPAAAPTASPPHTAKQRHAADAAPTAPADPGDVRLSGEVIDADESPVAGASVRALRDGDVVEETKSGADGRFTVRCGRRPRAGSVPVGVVAACGDLRSAFASVELLEDTEGDEDVGQIQLQRAMPLVARVVDAAGPVAGARVCVGTFFGTVFAAATADEKGVARFDAAPATDAWLFAYGRGRGRARGAIPDVRDPKVPLVLTLTARTIRVSVVETPAGAPAAGERITAQVVTDADGGRLVSAFVPALDLPATDEAGAVAVPDVAAEDAVEFRRLPREVSAEPWRSPGRSSGTGTTSVAGPRETEARLDVFVGRTIRWRIAAGDAAPPAEGATVSLTRGVAGWLPEMSPAALRVEHGELAGYGFSAGEVRGVAVAADGAIARLRPGEDARFTRPRTVAVTVRDSGGAPLPAVDVSLRSQADREVAAAVRTGADGRALFEGLEPEAGLLDVWTRTESPPDARCVATVDVTKSDAQAEVRLPRAVEFVLHVTTDGERRLPDSWHLYVDRQWDAAAAVEPPSDIRVVARPQAPGDPVHVLLRSEGECDAEADVVARPDGATVQVDLACDRGATLWVVYRPASPSLNVLQWCSLQTWSPSAQSWADWRDRPRPAIDRRAEPDGRFRFDSLPPGRYRLQSQLGIATCASAPVEVTAGAAPPPLVLDLSRAGLVRVRVVGADDKPVADAWVSVEGDGIGRSMFQPEGYRSSAGDGGYAAVVVPGDRPVRLVARHPLLSADSQRGSVEVTDAGGEYTLRLVDGPVLEFRIASVPDPAPAANVAVRRPGPASVSVRLFRGAVEGEPAASLTPLASDGGVLRAGGFAPGRYTIWIRAGGASIVLPDVELHDGVNDLGELTPPKGAAIRVRLAVPAGQAPPALRVTVTRVAGTRDVLEATSKGDAEIVLDGLVAGRYEVVVRPASGRATEILRRTVDCDGTHDVVIDSSPR